MRKILLILLFISLLAMNVYAVDYWDYPAYLVKNFKNIKYSDINAVKLNGEYYLFYKVYRGSFYSIEYYRSKDLKIFKGPYSTGISINSVRGFIPQYDVTSFNDRLYLVWDNLDGSLRVSYGQGEHWEKERIIDTGRNFCFKPGFFSINGELLLTYHTESEGRRIDFFLIRLDEDLNIVYSPIQIAKEFAGSFFPVIFHKNQNYYCTWQSRPFTEKVTPVFNIYMATSKDGVAWGNIKNMTGDVPGEKKFPRIYIEPDRFRLFYKSDRDGTWGLYSRFYDYNGVPIGRDSKINNTMTNVIGYDFTQINNSFYVFYTDTRDGTSRIYYLKESGNSKTSFGPINTGKYPVLDFVVLKRDNFPFLIYSNSRGIGYIGRDIHVSAPKILPIKKRIIGKKGITIKWIQPEDSSGIEGFCYVLTQNKDIEPELVNLSPEVNSLDIVTDKEGIFYFKIRSKDKAGNYSRTTSVKLNFDLTPPGKPQIVAKNLEEDGYFKDNKPYLKWSVKDSDIAGYNYAITKRPIKIKSPRIRTKRNRITIRGLKAGAWYFNLAAIDRAGNISETAHLKFKIKYIPHVAPQKKQEKKIITRPWIISHDVFVESPILSLLFYITLFSLTVAVGLAFYIYIKESIIKREMKMEEVETFVQVRKKRLGLRFKFSILIASLILILTVGISTILSYVTIEKEKTALSEQMIDKAKITLENITNVAREGILSNDELLLVSIIARTMKNKDIKYTIILDTNNRVIAHSDIKEKGKVYTDSFTVRASKSRSMIMEPEFNPQHLARLYDLASPVYFAKKRIGTVRIGYSTDSIFKTIEETKRSSIYSTIIVTLVTLIIGIIGAVIMATITIKPIKILAEGAYRIGSGDLDYKIHVKSRDEIGLLADEFNRMTERLKEYQKEMEKKAKLDEQLEIARSIQQSLIPQESIDNEYVSIGGFYKAATGVGGDYYDYIMRKERYGLIISDVAGKGVPASLMMTMIRTVFRSLINSGVIYPPRVVTLINNTLISDISADRFATLLFGMYDSKHKVFQYTNAGYGPILLYKKEKNECFLVEPKKSSIPIGVMPDVDYLEEPAIKMKSGDALILFTDGIHEARNEKEEEYGMARLAKIVPEIAGNSAMDIANAIIEDVMNFVGSAEQYDDMTLLVLKVK